ncbi:MAG: UDP binding domain-containing protein, partial [Lapillicoccus sp.]
TVACLGLAFKANVDDLRESPAVDIVTQICAGLPGTTVLVSEPYVDELPARLAQIDNLQLTSPDEAIERADIIVLLVDHEHFRAVKKSRLAGKVVYDTRGIWR